MKKYEIAYAIKRNRKTVILATDIEAAFDELESELNDSDELIIIEWKELNRGNVNV